VGRTSSAGPGQGQGQGQQRLSCDCYHFAGPLENAARRHLDSTLGTKQSRWQARFPHDRGPEHSTAGAGPPTATSHSLSVIQDRSPGRGR